uniref:Mitochondrial carrier protein n=1 Tax=Globodera pallida TaxID=36090 RepID=A0A183BMZ6_GLOPA
MELNGSWHCQILIKNESILNKRKVAVQKRLVFLESKKEDQESDLRPFQYVQAGFFTGVATRALIQPFDVIKIRLQLQEEPLHGKGAVISPHKAFRLSMFCTFELFTKQAVDLGLREFTKSVDFVCGAGAGCLATTCAMPFDVVRTRMVAQGAHRTYRNMAHAFIKTWRYEGPAGYFRGLVPSLLQIAPFTGLQFTFYNLVNVYWSSIYQGKNESIGQIVSGWMAGMAAKSITYPLDLVRHRLQVNRHIRKDAFGQTTSDKGMLRTFLGVIRRETVFGLFKGLSPAVLKAAVQSALSFFFYELVCDFLRS